MQNNRCMVYALYIVDNTIQALYAMGDLFNRILSRNRGCTVVCKKLGVKEVSSFS